jgi:hypothetical protein
MKYRVSDLKNDLAGKLHGTNLDKLHNVFGIIEDACRKVLSDVDLEETRRKSELPFIYLDEPLLALPIDLKKKKFIRINVNGEDDFKLVLTNTKNNQEDNVDIKYYNGFKAMEINGVEVPAGIQLIDFDSTDDLSGVNIENITRDSSDYIQGLASVSFDQVETGVFSITASSLSLNLLGHTDQSSFYMFIKIPPRGNISNFKIKAGADESNYFEITTTRTVYGTEFEEGWNLVKLDWRNAVNTGVPDPENIQFITCTFGDTSGLKLDGWKIDAITSNLQDRSFIEYYSKYMFINEDGSLSSRITSDQTSLVIDEGYDLLLAKLCQLANQQQHDYGYTPGSSETGYWASQYSKEKAKYQNDLPSSSKRTSTNYYKRRTKRL